jgi:heme-degrading monooxygenase HmoA
VYKSVLTLQALPGRRDDVLEVFARLDILRRSLRQDGAIDTTLTASLADEDLVRVISSWESPEAYQGWLDNPDRAEITAELYPLLAVPADAGTYRIVDSATAVA